MSQKLPRRRYRPCRHNFHKMQIAAVGGGLVQNLGWAYVCIHCTKWGGWVTEWGSPRRSEDYICKSKK